MNRPLIPQRIVLSLVVVAVLLPIALCVVLGVGALLTQMGDTAGGTVLARIALAGGILWAVNLICLLLTLAIGSLRSPDEE
jgi:type VI protein secretion system component VasK